MSAQPVHHDHDPRVRAIPRTINAIGEALAGTKRAQFYSEVLAAEQRAVADVMERWWLDAMLDQSPGRERRVEHVLAGQGLVPLPEVPGGDR